MRLIAGTATGWAAGQAHASGNSKWLFWPALSRLLPSQQLGKLAWSRSSSTYVIGQAGGVDDCLMSLSTPQFQKVILMSCGAIAFESPAIISSPAGKAWTRVIVLRR